MPIYAISQIQLHVWPYLITKQNVGISNRQLQKEQINLITIDVHLTITRKTTSALRGMWIHRKRLLVFKVTHQQIYYHTNAFSHLNQVLRMHSWIYKIQVRKLFNQMVSQYGDSRSTKATMSVSEAPRLRRFQFTQEGVIQEMEDAKVVWLFERHHMESY